MYYPADRQEHATILGDLAVYGDHAPHLRYRQERMRAMMKTVTAAQLPGHTAPQMTIRTRIGSRLIAWGRRLEGCSAPTAAHPA